MKLITLPDGSRDGRRHVASSDPSRAAPADGIAATLQLPLQVDRNGQQFGRANGHAMALPLAGLVAHAVRMRMPVAGAIIGSGTLSDDNFREPGPARITGRRGIGQPGEGSPRTDSMAFGDRARMAARAVGGSTPFGAIGRKVARA